MTTPSRSEILLYEADDGRTRIECRLEEETLWLAQVQLAELFETTVPNITGHTRDACASGEQTEEATCKGYLQVRMEGARRVSRSLRAYRLEVILAVGGAV